MQHFKNDYRKQSIDGRLGGDPSSVQAHLFVVQCLSDVKTCT